MGAVTAVTHVSGLAQVAVEVEPGDPRGLEMLRHLADAGISIDLINLHPDRKVFCIDERRAPRARAVLTGLGLAPRVRTGLVKVSVVGAGMRGRPGVMATIAEALAGAGVEILQTADSHVTISCLIQQEDLERAVRALHRAFGLGSGN